MNNPRIGCPVVLVLALLARLFAPSCFSEERTSTSTDGKPVTQVEMVAITTDVATDQSNGDDFVISVARLKNPNGTVSIEVERKVFADGRPSVLHGKFIENDPHGKKFKVGQYADNLRVGIWDFWHANGKLGKTGAYNKDKPHGRWLYYREDGTCRREEKYVDGKRDGAWIEYFEDGTTVRKQSTFRADKLHGKQIEYNEDGEKTVELEFKNGKPRSTGE